jgi:hypothetical protein
MHRQTGPPEWPPKKTKRPVAAGRFEIGTFENAPNVNNNRIAQPFCYYKTEFAFLQVFFNHVAYLGYIALAGLRGFFVLAMGGLTI